MLPELQMILDLQTDVSELTAVVVVVVVVDAAPVVVVVVVFVVESRLVEVVAVAVTVVFAVQFVVVEAVTEVHIHGSTADTLRPVQLRNSPTLQKLQRKT